MIVLEQGFRILFTGDSITDCGRDRSDIRQLGSGYPFMIAGRLGASLAEMQMEFFNTGIGGDSISSLKKRWTADCIALKPDIVSILIGINDVWPRYEQNRPVPVDVFKNDYREIIEKTLDALPSVQLVLLEPFLLPSQPDRVPWREDLDPKIQAVRELARDYADSFLPLDGTFAEASCRAPMTHWLPDGVHPSPAAHSLIADLWIDNVCV